MATRHDMLSVAAPHVAGFGVVVFGFDNVTAIADRAEIVVIIRAAPLQGMHMVGLPFVAGVEFPAADMALPVS